MVEGTVFVQVRRRDVTPQFGIIKERFVDRNEALGGRAERAGACLNGPGLLTLVAGLLSRVSEKLSSESNARTGD